MPSRPTEAQAEDQAEKYPVVSREWVGLAGVKDVSAVCRFLALQHHIDRRIDLRLVNILERKPAPLGVPSDVLSAQRKAAAIAQYIGDFRETNA